MVLKNKGFLLSVFLFAFFSLTAQTDFVFSDAVKPDSVRAPFSTKDSLIQVKAFVNGKEELFILDNACPYLVINSRHWEMKSDSSIYARGIGGVIESGTVFIDSFNWQGIQKAKFKAVAANLANLGDSICGLIGYDVFKEYEFQLNFDSSWLELNRANNEISREDFESNQIAIPFQMVKHLPVVKIVLEKDTLLMGIDCGNSQSLLYASSLSRFYNISHLRNTILRGGGDSAILVREGVLNKFTIDTLSYEEMKFSFDDRAMGQINQSLPIKIDGLLGLDFLKEKINVSG